MNIETAKFITATSSKSKLGKSIDRTRQCVSQWPSDDPIPDDAEMRVLRCGGLPVEIDKDFWPFLQKAIAEAVEKYHQATG